MVFHKNISLHFLVLLYLRNIFKAASQLVFIFVYFLFHLLRASTERCGSSFLAAGQRDHVGDDRGGLHAPRSFRMWNQWADVRCWFLLVYLRRTPVTCVLRLLLVNPEAKETSQVTEVFDVPWQRKALCQLPSPSTRVAFRLLGWRGRFSIIRQQ